MFSLMTVSFCDLQGRAFVLSLCPVGGTNTHSQLPAPTEGLVVNNSALQKLPLCSLRVGFPQPHSCCLFWDLNSKIWGAL